MLSKAGGTVVEPPERSWRTQVRPFVVPGLLLLLTGWLLVLVWFAFLVVQATLSLGTHFFAAP